MNWNDAGIGMATGAANGAIGQGMGLIFGAAQDRRQLKQAGKLQELQIAGNKEMGQFNREQAMRMWNDTNSEAQVAHLKKAGLNVGLAMGGGAAGAGGVTANAGGSGSVSGQSAGDPNTGVGMGIQIASQLALQQAQTENIKADTENKKAGAGKALAETDTEKENAEIRGNERTISDATMKEQRTIVEQKAINSILENEATRTGINVDKARINEITTSLQQRWEGLRLEGKSIEQSKENMEKLTEAMLWGAGIQAAGNIVRDIVGIVTKQKPKDDNGSLIETTRQNFKGGSHTTTSRTPIR